MPFSSILRWKIFFNSTCLSSSSRFFAYYCWAFSTLLRKVFWYFYRPFNAAGVTPTCESNIGSSFVLSFVFFRASSLLTWLDPLSLCSGCCAPVASYLFLFAHADYFSFDFLTYYFRCSSSSSFLASISYFFMTSEGSPNKLTIFLSPSAFYLEIC